MLCYDSRDDIFDLFCSMMEEQPILEKRAHENSEHCDDDADDDMPLANEHSSNSTKRGRGKHLGFSARSILPQLLENYANDELLSHAAETLAKCMYLHESDRKMRFLYTFDISDSRSNLSLCLTVLKGSLSTVVWSTVARYDDEYVLEMFAADEEARSPDHAPALLWAMKGLDMVAETGLEEFAVGSTELNWPAFRTLQTHLQLQHIGVHAFVRLISKIIINLPSFEREGQLLEPMPASIMYAISEFFIFPMISCLFIDWQASKHDAHTVSLRVSGI